MSDPHITNGNGELSPQEQKYQFCLDVLSRPETATISALKDVRNKLQVMGDYQDSEQLLARCLQLLEEKKQAQQSAIVNDKNALPKKQKNRSIRWIIPTVVLLIAAIAAVFVWLKVLRPGSQYQNAMDLYAAQKYDEAIDILNMITNYKDARAKLLEIKTAKAKDLFGKGKQEQAINLLYENGDVETRMVLETSLLKEANVGSIVYFGNYYIHQDCTIPWEVLAKEDGKLLLFADRAVEEQRFDDNGFSNDWEISSLRHFLNGDFYQIAFSDEEKAMIAETELLNANWRYWFDFGKTGELNDEYLREPSKDRVFLLTEYDLLYAYKDTITKWKISEHGYWLTRTDGEWGDMLGFSDKDDSSLYCSIESESPVRPAVWVDLSTLK